MELSNKQQWVEQTRRNIAKIGTKNMSANVNAYNNDAAEVGTIQKSNYYS